jgi:hypothetical protein
MSTNTEQSRFALLQNVYNIKNNNRSDIYSVRRAYLTAINITALTVFENTRPYMPRLHIIKFHYLILRILLRGESDIAAVSTAAVTSAIRQRKPPSTGNLYSRVFPCS